MAFKRSRHNPRNVITSYASVKMGGPVGSNSTIEADLCPLMDYERWIKRFESEPWTIEAPFHDGSTHKYTMDYWADTDDGFAIIECKPFDRKDSGHTLQQIKIGSSYAAENGGLFLFVTDRDLRAGHYLANVKVLCRYRYLIAPPDLARRCIAFVAPHQQGVRLWDIAAHLAGGADPSTHIGCVYSLLFRHLLHADLHVGPIGADSLAFLPEHRPSEAEADLTARHFGGPLRIGVQGPGNVTGDTSNTK